MDVIEDQESEEEEVNSPYEHNSEDENLYELIESDQELEGSPNNSEPDDNAQHFDIALAAEHTYMGEDLRRVGSAAVVEVGQTLVVPGLATSCIVFPGELVPLRLPRAAADTLLSHPDKLLVLLAPYESAATGEASAASGFGALCELRAAAAPDSAGAVCLKARALHRVRLCADRADRADRADPRHPHPPPLHYYDRPRSVRVRVLAEGGAASNLRAAASPRAACLMNAAAAAAAARSGSGGWRGSRGSGGSGGWRGSGGSGGWRGSRRLRALSASAAASTPWPPFVYEAYSLPRLRALLTKHFHQHYNAPLPQECSALSAWACANASLSFGQRLALLKEDGALARIVLLLRMLAQKGRLLYCVTCGSALAKRCDEIAMTTAGVHGHYANPGGYTHDVVTVRRARGLARAGEPSDLYSWFPGYTWQVVLCTTCRHHRGWRFKAASRRLFPRHFYALCRDYVSPHRPSASRPRHLLPH